MLDLVQLRSFAEVAERGSVAAAATALGYTPPAVSQHLAKLERALGQRLFDRVGGAVVVNDRGQRLLPRAHELLQLATLATTSVHDRPENPEIVITGFASALSVLVTPALPHLTAQARIRLVEADDAVALRELRLGHTDVALIQRYSGERPTADPRYHELALCHDPLRLVLPPSYPVDATLDDLNDLPWLMNGAGTRCDTVTRRILSEHGLEPDFTADVSDNGTLIQLVAAGHGATIVPGLMVEAVGGAVTVSSQDLGVERTILAVTRLPSTQTAADAVAILRASTGAGTARGSG